MRIEGTVATLAPELKVIAPVRSWAMGRDEEIAYARKHGIPVKGGTESAPYSIDDNLWGRSSEGKWIEDLSHAPDDDVFQLVTRPELAPDEAEVVDGRRSRRACPVALDGERLGPGRPDRAGGRARHAPRRRDRRPHRGPDRRPEGARHLRGAGGGDPAEGAQGARAARAARSTRTSSSRELDQQWAYLVYAGLWWEPLREDIEAYVEHVNRRVTGTIGLKLFKGSVRVVTRESPNAVYDAQLATFAESGGLFSQQASPGFIEIWSLQSRMAQRVRGEE